MKVWTDETQFDLNASVVALGMFDGVHKGHQQLIRQARTLADELGTACVVYTFDRHPLSVLRPGKEPMQLITQEEKLEKFRKLGADGVLLKPFTPEYASTEPEAYLKRLVRTMNVRAIVAGFNYTFGDRGRGDSEMIRAYAKLLGYRAEILQPVCDDRDVISSTLIRALLQNGDRRRAQRLLSLE